MKKQIENILYKPLAIDDVDRKSLIFPYAYEISNVQNISSNNVKTSSVKHILYILNITRSIDNGFAAYYTFTVENLETFLNNVEHIDVEEIKEEMDIMMSILNGEISDINTKFTMLSKISFGINYSLNPKNESNLVIVNNEEGVAHIVLNTIENSEKKLTKEHVEKIGNVIMDIILENQSMDTEDDAQVNQFRKEVELRLIDALPHEMQAGEINLNIDYILKEIRRFQIKDKDNE